MLAYGERRCYGDQIPGQLIKSRNPLTIVLAGAGLEPVARLLKKTFRKNGDRVFDTTNYRAEWYKACISVKVGFRKDGKYEGQRCSAAINMIDAGVSEDVVMKIEGWKTTAMLSRYNVMNTDRIRKAMERGGSYVADQIAAAQ